MRQVFSSPRIENVDRVEAMMHEAGIDTYVSNRDKLRRDRMRSFSYTAPPAASSWPAVWIKQAEDLPRAREMLRDAGLMGSTRPDVATRYQLSPRMQSNAPRTASHIRRVMLVLLAVSAIFFFAFRMLQSPAMQTPIPARAPAPIAVPVATPATPEDFTIIVLDESTRPAQ